MRKIYLLLILLLAPMFYSCGTLDYVAGTNFDQEQFTKAREAKIMEMRLKYAQDLKSRLSNNDPLENADFTMCLDEQTINKLLDQYKSSTGMLDDATDYVIKDVKLKLLNGASIASIELLAHNETHNIDIQLMMDCLITLIPEGSDLNLKLEPFNITPVVTARGIYSSARDVIKKLIALNLSDLGKKLPKISIPINIENELAIKGTKTDIKSKINLSINIPDRTVSYKLVIKELQFFENKIFIALNLNKIKVN
jgi:hypothetical protein